MYSTVHAVFVVDLSKLVSLSSSVSETEHIAKIKLLCLKLLHSFSTKTKRAQKDVLWSWKFYDSHTSRLDSCKIHFLDFEMNAFHKFEAQLTDKYRKASDNKLALEERERSMYELPHSFVLKQALLEVLLDYTWDSPDISSPVKTTTRSDGSVELAPLPANDGTYNVVIVITNVPRNFESSCEASPEVFLANVLDDVKIKAFQKKKVSISLIDMREPVINWLPFKRRTKLAKLGGSLYSITDFIQTQPKCVARTSSAGIPECGQKGVAVFSKQMEVPWLTSQIIRARKPLPGPTLLWEDADRMLHLSTQLQVLAVHGSCSRAWGSATVVGVVQTSQVSLLALAQETCSLYICVDADETLGGIITVLTMHQLSLMLQLSGGSLAFFSPSEKMTGCLALVSVSGSAAFALDMPNCSPSTLQLVSAAVRECLKNVAPHVEQESVSSSRWFSGSMVQRWFRPLPHPALSAVRVRNKLTPHRRAMLERLRKRYQSEISLLGDTQETDSLNLMDIFQPQRASQLSQATLTSSTMTQQLFRRNPIVTAQQRVKEQLVEEKRRAAKAREHSPEVQFLRSISNPQNEKELIQSLIDQRETIGVEADIFTTAQTIINLACVHVRNTTVTTTLAVETMQEVFYRVMMCGVLQSAAEIFNHPQQETHLHQYKLHVLLHLELLFVLGYPACSKQSEGREEKKEEEGDKRKEHHVEEVVKLLRAISLHHGHSVMVKFLEETVVENYLEILRDILLEVYDELSQTLPPPLQDIVDEKVLSIQSSLPPPSVKSKGIPTQYSVSATDSDKNPGYSHSREGRQQHLNPRRFLQAANKRSILAPKVTRAISRTISEEVRSPRCQPVFSGPSSPAAGNMSYIPDTPETKTGSTVSKLMSMGTTCIEESPNATISCHELRKTTPNRLHPSLPSLYRNSFFSGTSSAHSRNCERARIQLLTDHIKGCVDHRVLNTGSQQSSKNAGFLFSNILSDNPVHSSSQIKTVQQNSKQLMAKSKNISNLHLNIRTDNDSEKKDDNGNITKVTSGGKLQNKRRPAASLYPELTGIEKVKRVLF